MPQRGKPLIVDEAWGAHLPFHEDLPTWAMDAGQLSACADMLMTTSPNVMVYAALDGWRRQMVQQGHALLDAALSLADRVRDEIEAVGGLHVLRDEFLDSEASHDLDPLHVVIDVSELGISGYDAADWLREHQRLDMGCPTTAASRPPCQWLTTTRPRAGWKKSVPDLRRAPV